MRKFIPILSMILVVGNAFAWHRDKPAGAQYEPEQTEAQLAEAQKKQVVVGEVGHVPGKTEEAPTIAIPDESTKAEKAFQDRGDKSGAAASALKTAHNEARAGAGSSVWIWVLLGAATVATGTAVYRWTVRDMPNFS